MVDMKGKICAVTGASGGVGKAIALGLQRMGATVVVVGRDAAKLRGVSEHVVEGQLESIADTKRIAGEIARRWGKVHVLVHNACVMPAGTTRRVSADGLEIGFAVNALAPYVLTLGLEDALQAAAPSRVVYLVGSSKRFDPADVEFAHGWNGWDSYQRGKYAGLLAMHALAKRFAGTGVTVNGAFPGLVDTPGMDDTIRAMSFGQGLVIRLMRPFMRTPQRGAESTLWVASAPELEGETDKLWSIKKPLGMKIDGWNDDAAAQQLVARIEAVTR